jgi:hypothetical protein
MVEEVISMQEIGLKPKYRVGKITNKYLIIDIFAFAFITREEAIYRMFR